MLSLLKDKTLLLSLSCLSFVALSITPAQAKTPIYKIEVIVFESMALKGWTEEFWPSDIELPVTEGSHPLTEKGKSPLWFNNQKSDLDAEVAKLNKKGYRVLFHQAWSQMAYGNKNAPTTLVENNQARGSNLLGTVRLYRTRFAHVNFDLEFERRIPETILEDFMKNQKISLNEVAPTHWRFNLKESRKIKYGELHYIDHPLFGVLVQVEQLNQ